jgi:hypothetical protein
MIKAAQNKDFVFQWESPYPLASTPTLAYTLPNGTTRSASNMTSVHASLSVTAIGSDRRTLTLSASASASGRIGARSGRAFLSTDEDGLFLVTVDRIDGTTAILADLVPRGLALTSSASLVWAGYEFTIPSADTATRGMIAWTVNYTSDEDPNDRSLLASNVIEVVRRPFDTGLTHSDLVAKMPQLGDMIPRRQQDLSEQIAAALEELVLYIRDDLLEDQTEDDIFNQHIFIEAHRYLSASRVYEMTAQLDIAERMSSRAMTLFQKAMRQLTIDTDDDGLIDSDEINLRRTGGKVSDARGPFSLPSVEPTQREQDIAIQFPRWRGMQH